MKYTIKWESDGKNGPIIWEKYGYQFPWFSPYDEICCIFPYHKKLMGKPMHFHMMKYTIGWESNGKKTPILWEKYEHQFPDFPHTMSFVAFSRTVENSWGNPYISHVPKYAIGWELDRKKALIFWEKYCYQYPRLSPIPWFLLHFPIL